VERHQDGIAQAIPGCSRNQQPRGCQRTAERWPARAAPT